MMRAQEGHRAAFARLAILVCPGASRPAHTRPARWTLICAPVSPSGYKSAARRGGAAAAEWDPQRRQFGCERAPKRR
jgi:hypothetical protein